MPSEDKKARRILAGGIVALAVALGISRFAYTPLLPLMQQDLSFGDDFAGFLASANYAGYLIGALWAVWTAQRENRLQRLRVNLALTIVSTLAMGLTVNPTIWLGLRFLSGSTGAMVFILISGIVLEALTELRRQAWSGWLYAGVGVGITLSAVLVPLLNHFFGWQGGWLGLGALSVVFALAVWRLIPAETLQARAYTLKPQAGHPGLTGMLPWLTIAYACEGLGYIVTGTFLVAWLERSAELAYIGSLAWLVVGLAAVPSCLLWMKAGLRFGLTGTLVFAHLIQAVGILLPVFAPSVWGAVSAGAFFGGTFLGIAALSLVLGRTIAPERSDRVIATLTAAFGVGQMLGPAIAGILADHTQSFIVPLFCAAGVVVLGALFLVIGLVYTRLATSRHVTIEN